MTNYKLCDICEIINGFTPSTKNKEFWTNGTIPFYRRENLISDNKPFKKINISAFDKKHKKTLQEGTILSGNTSLIVKWKKENIHFKDHMFLLQLKDNSNVNEKYIHFYLIRNRKILFKENSKTNSMFAVVEKKEISDFDINLPEYKYQEVVGKILWEKFLMINNLKTLIRNQEKELDLFFKTISKKLENSELTEYRVDDLCKIIQGMTPPTKTKPGEISPWKNNEVLFYRGRDFTRNDGNTDKKVNMAWIQTKKKERLLIRPGDISIYDVGTISVLNLPINSIGCNHVITLRNKNKKLVNSEFLSFYLKKLENDLNHKYASVGTLFKTLRVVDLLRVPIFLPLIEIQNKIGDTLKVKQQLLDKTKQLLKDQESLLDIETKILIK